MRKRMIYHGRVQGVGFRYTAATIARQHPVTGYVKNLPDGTVEVVADGSPETVHEFLSDIEEAFRGNITDADSQELQPDEEFSDFRVRYS